MSHLIIFGATGSLGSHVLRLALAAGHQVTVFVRSPSRLPPESGIQVSVQQGDLSTHATVEIAKLAAGGRSRPFTGRTVSITNASVAPAWTGDFCVRGPWSRNRPST